MTLDAPALLAHLVTLDANGRAAEMRRVAALPPHDAAEFALALLSGLQEAHGPLVGMACAQLLLDHGTAAQVAPLQALRPTLPGMSGLRDWRVDVDTALAAMSARAAGGCACASVHVGNNAPSDDRFEVLARREQPYVSELDVACRVCGKRFTVEVDDSYHYPIFRWR